MEMSGDWLLVYVKLLTDWLENAFNWKATFLYHGVGTQGSMQIRNQSEMFDKVVDVEARQQELASLGGPVPGCQNFHNCSKMHQFSR